MANYAYNSITLITPNTEQDLLNLEFFVTNLLYLYDTKGYICNPVTQAMSEAYGTKKFNFDRRDSFNWLSDEISYNDILDVWTYDVQLESAWVPLINRFQEWVQSMYPNIKVVGTCEEPGNGIYINTDKDGYFFETRYALDVCFENKLDDYYFDTLQDVVDKVRETIDIDKDCSYNTLCKAITDYNNSEDKVNDVEGFSLTPYDDTDDCSFADMAGFIPQPEN